MVWRCNSLLRTVRIQLEHGYSELYKFLSEKVKHVKEVTSCAFSRSLNKIVNKSYIFCEE